MIVAEECVLRGADWLERRWRDGGTKLKHMAIALRAAGPERRRVLRAVEEPRGQLGRSGCASSSPTTPGDSPTSRTTRCPEPTGEWAYDALNEVWFDDVEGLRARIEWFRENLPDHRDDGLFRQSWFLAAREDVVLA